VRLVITEDEWRTALRRAGEVGSAMGAGRAAVLGARSALEALGVSVPVVEEEFEDPPPVTVARTADAPGAGQTGAEGPRPSPSRDLRVMARTAVGVDGYCAACGSIQPAAALGVSTTGRRLCPIHGVAVRDVIEVAEGRFELAPLPGERSATVLDDSPECGAPLGGAACRLNAGHLGRHNPRRAVAAEPEADGDEHAPYPFEDHPA
jgi:hypothetical protein